MMNTYCRLGENESDVVLSAFYLEVFVVSALARLLSSRVAEVSLLDHHSQKLRRYPSAFVRRLVERFQVSEPSIKSDEVGEFKGAHRMVVAESHARVDVREICDTIF